MHAMIEVECMQGIYKIESINYDKTDLLLNTEIKNNLLYSVGNPHAGTYYTAIEDALRFIVQIAIDGNHFVAKNCAINALIDLYYFYPANGSTILLNQVQQEIRNEFIFNRNSILQFFEADIRNVALRESFLSIIIDA